MEKDRFMRSRLRWLLAFVVVWLAVGCTQLPTVQPGISLPDAGLLPIQNSHSLSCSTQTTDRLERNLRLS